MGQGNSPYYQAARFPNKKSTGPIYQAVQQLLYEDVACDLSAFRLQINGIWHVVVIGEKPSGVLHEQIEAQLTNGMLVTLDARILSPLLRRRGEAIQLGPWVEGHYSSTDEEGNE